VSDSLVHSVSLMGTVVTFQIVGHGADRAERAARDAAVERAIAWFERVTEACSRFEPASELCRLCATVGEPVPVSALLFEPLRFALAVAEESGGAFDPTVGATMERRGFNREFRTGTEVRVAPATKRVVSYRDVQLVAAAQTVTLRAPLLLDLGAVAKGLAVDMAARELQPFINFAIDAGGDMYFGGHNERGAPWSVGIRHPRQSDALVETLQLADCAVCTSGDYERTAPSGEGHHLLDPRADASAGLLASATVVAPSAMVADALATAAFVLGPVDGLRLLETHGVRGLLVTPSMERFATGAAA